MISVDVKWYVRELAFQYSCRKKSIGALLQISKLKVVLSKRALENTLLEILGFCFV